MKPPLRKRAEALLGWSPAEVPALPTRDVQELVRELQGHETELEVQNEELRRAQQETVAARDRYLELRQAAAELQTANAALHDSQRAALNLMEDAVEARQAAERVSLALQASEQRMQQALRVSRSLTFEWQPDTDLVLRSASCAAILGLGGEEAIHDTGQRFFQRVHPEDREHFTQVLQGLAPAADTYTTEYRVVRGDGSVVVLEETGQASFDAAGRLQRLVGVSTDITARKQAEAALRASEELNRRTLQALPAHIAVIDRQGRIVTVNQAWLEFARSNEAAGSPAVAVGADYLAVCRRAAVANSPEAAEALAGIEAVLAGSREQFSLEYPCHSPQQQRWFLMTVAPFGAGGAGGAVITHVNISARRLAEEALRELNAQLESANTDLTRLNRAMVGRELRMIELKNEVNEVCALAGQPARYALDLGQDG